MNILFRVDGYPEIGLGHFVRSIAIASGLRDKTPLNIIFAGTFSENTKDSLKNKGFQFISPDKNEDEQSFINRANTIANSSLIFIDNLYPYSEEFIIDLRSKVRLVLFHNLCPGAYYADAFILPSAHHPDKILKDSSWKKNKVAFFSGLEYIPINEHIIKQRNKSFSKRKIKQISITTGGSDPKGVMLKLLKWINAFGIQNVKFKALIGSSFINIKELNELLPQLSPDILVKDFNYQDLVYSDLVISTFGVTSYELIYMGIPFISVSHAEKNAEGSKILSAKHPLIKDLGIIDNLQQIDFKNALHEVLANPDLKDSFLKLSNELMDDKGINRIISVILSLLNAKK